mmetsp:Transcript_182/g.296  ORF Transcript_182/g.296 Transcript_182/m.296 type:complete len:218 (-) Transcript_182:1562-2215(-)
MNAFFRRGRHGPQNEVDIKVVFPFGRTQVTGNYPSKWRAEQNPPVTEREFFTMKRHVETIADRHSELNELRTLIQNEQRGMICVMMTVMLSFALGFLGGFLGGVNGNTTLLILGIISIFIFVFGLCRIVTMPQKLKELQDRYFGMVIGLNLEEELSAIASAATVRIVDISNKTWKFKITIERAETAVPYAYAGSEEPKPAIAIEEDYMAQDVKGLYP